MSATAAAICHGCSSTAAPVAMDVVGRIECISVPLKGGHKRTKCRGNQTIKKGFTTTRTRCIPFTTKHVYLHAGCRPWRDNDGVLRPTPRWSTPLVFSSRFSVAKEGFYPYQRSSVHDGRRCNASKFAERWSDVNIGDHVVNHGASRNTRTCYNMLKPW